MNWFVGVLIDAVQVALIAWLLMLLAPLAGAVGVGFGVAVWLTIIVYLPTVIVTAFWSVLNGS